MHISIGNTKIDVDVEATRLAYAKMNTSGPEECGCSFCRNWAAQREAAYPASVRELLEAMGIRFGFETEVWDCQWDNHRRYCSGWYPFVGRIIHESEEPTDMDGMEIFAAKGLSYSAPWFPAEDVHEIHFSTVVDWILNEPAEIDPGEPT